LICFSALASAQGERLPRVAWVVIGTPESSRAILDAMRAGLADENLDTDVGLQIRDIGLRTWDTTALA